MCVFHLQRSRINHPLTQVSSPSQCLLGKDRTGVLASLLLHSLGVSLEDILSDYSVTEQLLEKHIRLQAIIVEGADPHFAEAPPAEMMNALQEISLRYGSLDAYLDSIGFGQEDRERLRDNLLIPAKSSL
jgi:protein-tyrosine phosphatase